MTQETPVAGEGDFRLAYALLFLLGCCGLAAIILAALPLKWGALGWRGLLGMVAAAAAGFVLRSLRRRLVMGPAISWHQSIAYEVVIQTVRLASPFLPPRPFETEFMIRELDDPGSRTRIHSWLAARDVSTWVMVLSGAAGISALYGFWAPAIAGWALAVALFGTALARSRDRGAVASAVLTGALCWGSEGFLFAYFASPALDPAAGWTLYLCATGLLEFSPVPLGLGVAEAPALLYFSRMGSALPPLLAFHAARALVLAPLGVLYLHRFKLAVSDLFSPDVVAAVRQSQRPEGGWPWGERPADDAPVVSVVIPAYNEELRLPEFLDSVEEYMESRDFSMEVVVVDDGSRDNTAGLVEERSARDPRIRLIRQVPNQGKGAAVRRGVLEARGRYVLFADADGATPIAELDRFRAAMGENIEIVIGSRKVTAHDVERKREGVREMMGSAFYTTVNLLAVPGIRDTQCGFKMFRRDVARRLFSWTAEKGWAFDVEVLYLAQRVGYAIREVAVNWHAVEGSKVSPVKDSIKMFLAVFRIRARQAGFIRHAKERACSPSA